MLAIMLGSVSKRSAHCYRSDFRCFARAWDLAERPEHAADHIVSLGRSAPALLSHAITEIRVYCRDMGDAKSTISRRFRAIRAFFRVIEQRGEAWPRAVVFPRV